MRTPRVLSTPIALVLLISVMPARAAYSEHWMTNAEIAHAQPKSAAPQKPVKPAPKPPRHTVAATADDDPIAAFAHAGHAQHKTAHR
ncbi:hypothetical protein BSFA1_09620 [Burkholderia sp. SFA1]|nr:hypothetical protein BSFA1_09620 [Burkholderia sp. SFA1]